MAISIVPIGAATVVHLEWDANTEVDLEGYRLLYGTTSGSYTNTIEIGNQTAFDVIDLPAGVMHYFVAVAYDTAGNVSTRSNEVSAQPITLAPVPAISVTDSPDPVAAGSTITYTIGYANTGNVDATGVSMTDPVPLNTTFVAATGGGTLSGGVVTWSIGTLAAGSSGSVQMVVRAASGLANGTIITNSSYALRSSEISPLGGPAVSTTVTSTPVLSVMSTDSPDPVAAGANLTYTISYSNTGNATATGLLVRDTIPSNTTFVSAAGGAVPVGGVVSWPVANLSAGASGSVTLTVRVQSPLANGTLITNSTYSIDSAETSPASGAPVTTTVSSSPVLTIAKTASAGSVAPGSNLTYTLAYSNTGNANASGVVINDTIPANTTFVSATGGGTLSGGVVRWSPGALNAPASGFVQLVVRVNSPLANGTVISNSTYNIDSNETSAVSGAAVNTTVSSAPTLAISKTASAGSVAPGSSLTYTLAYSNTGNANTSGVVITDTLPANTTFVSATGGGTLSGSVVSWTIGSVNTSASGSVQLVVRVGSPLASGTVITNSTYGIDSNETSPANGAPVTTTVSSAPMLTIAKTAGTSSVSPGANITYTLTYSNTGSANASGVVITDTLPADTTFVSATGGGTLSAGVVTWSLVTVNAGASGSVQLVVQVANPLTNGTVITNSTYGIDATETSPVGGAPVATTVTATSAPTVTSVVEVSTGSIYIVRPGVQTIRVEGTDFQPGATLSLGPGIASTQTTFIDSMHLTANILTSVSASLGPLGVTVTNPDLGSGSKDRALKVVKPPDCNGNCMIDGLDLNTLARSWGKVSTDIGFISEADMSGDGLVDGEDLDVLANYFGTESPDCP